MKFDNLLTEYLGEFGRFQKVQFLLICMPIIFTSMHSLSWTFVASPLPHRCRLEGEPKNASYWTSSDALHTIPCDESKCHYEECRLGDEKGCPNGFVFDNSEITFSALQRWDIACDRQVLKAIIQSTYYMGQGIGALLFGFLADRIGRKKVYVFCIVMQVTSGLLMAIAPHWSVYAILRGVLGFSHPGTFAIGMVIAMELVGPTKRRIASVLSGMFFSFGQVILGILGYVFRDYQHLHIAYGCPALIFLSYWWLVSESPRWLISVKQHKKADEILQKAAKINKTELPEKWWDEVEDIKSESKKAERKNYNLFDLFRTPIIRQRTLAFLFLWPVVSMVYYGVSMKTDFLGGGFYATFIFGGLIEIPALVLVYILVDKIGRKPLLASGYFVAAFCILSNLLTPKAHWIINMVQFLLAKAALTLCYAVIYTVTPELFPTVIRNIAMGCCSMIARIGAISASYISMWIVDNIGVWAMVIPFGSLTFAAGIIVLIFIPETQGKSLPETINEIEAVTFPEAQEMMKMVDSDKP